MTRDAEEFSVGGREYTVPRNDLSSKPKGWIREGSKIGPVLDADTNCHQGKPGIDLTEKSRIPDEEENDSARMGQPGSQELRIEPRSRKETDRPSAKAKLEPSLRSIQQSSLEQIQIPERRWLDVKPDLHKYTTLSHNVSKRMLRHEQDILGEED